MERLADFTFPRGRIVKFLNRLDRVAAFFAAALVAPAALAVASPMQEQATDEDARFLRVVEQAGESVSLELAARRYARPDGAGPEVCLVSVAHIGDESLYTSLQSLLDEFDLVLYESVKPAGAGRPGGDTDEERAASTQASMRFISGVLQHQRESTDAYPADLEELATSLEGEDPRLAQWIELAAIDAWGNQLALIADAEGFQLTSLGADNQLGGEGANADLVVSSDDASDPLALTGDDGLQAQLADALDLAFQLEAVDYNRSHFRCSDMTVDQLERELAVRGVDFSGLSGTLAGTSFSAQVVRFLLTIVKAADAIFEGRVSDYAKLMMIEVLGNEDITEAALDQQFGAGFAEVIVGERNQVVMDDLAQVIETEPEVKSIAIFYGAAHMPDFETRLREQLGYEPSDAQWIPGMTLDLQKSALSELEINQMRFMIRQTMRSMMRSMQRGE